jgi:hypothetical protein
MLCKIIKCSDKKGWYKDLINEIIEVKDNIKYTVKNSTCSKTKIYEPLFTDVYVTMKNTKWKLDYYDYVFNSIAYYYCETNFNKNKKIIIDIKYRMIIINDVEELTKAEVRKYKINLLKNGIRTDSKR